MDDFARVKAAVDILAVIGEVVPLKKRGSSHVGLCPFHAEKTPSFGVVPEGQYFHCFGCGKGGDVFVFLQEIQHIEPVEALRQLAEESGITLSESGRDGGRRRLRHERLRAILEAAQAIFREGLRGPAGQEVSARLVERGISLQTQEEFGIGYAVSTSRLLVNTLRKREFKDTEMEEAGLVWRRDSSVRDVFRERIMIPIRDERGRTVAFGARRRRDGPDAPQPKYMNSRDHPLFHKGQILYGIDRARPRILARHRAVLVEGYMDVILAHQAGLEDVVAALGTSVTADHALRLARIADEVVLFLDGDEAGRRACLKALPLLMGEALRVRVLTLDEGRDPGDYFSGGADAAAFESFLEEEGQEGVDFALRALGAGVGSGYEDRVTVARRFVEILGEVKDPLARAAALQHAARELDLPEDALNQLIRSRPARVVRRLPAEDAPPRTDEEEPEGIGAESKQNPARKTAEEELLISLIRQPELREVVLELLPEDTICHPLRARLLREIVAHSSARVVDLLSRFSGEKEAQQVLLDLVERPVHADPGKLFDGAIQFFERERKTEQRRLLQDRYKGALRRGDSRAALDYLTAYQAGRESEQS